MRLGSLFDGIGGWPLAAEHNGITPVWASEIEKFPKRVTRFRFPDMVQLGDIRKIDGAWIEPVDIMCAGSPCQNLSVAGNQKGLDGSESSLFYEAIRVFREMRRATNGKYPRFFVWENVPGAFSSNGGRDFRAVLSEITDTEIPMPSGRWADAGMAECDQCQIAWRCLDAQYFGLPQRRKRIFLVADFAESGRGAAKILFESEGMRGDPAQGEKTEQGTSNEAEGIPYCAGREGMEGNGDGKHIRGEDDPDAPDHDSFCLQGSMIGRKDENGPLGQEINHEISFTLNATDRHAVSCQSEVGIYDISHRSDAVRPQKDGKIPCMAARYGTGGCNVPIITVEAVHQNQRNEVRLTKISGALTTGGGKPGTGYPCVFIKDNTVCLNDQGGNSMNVSENIVSCLRAESHGHNPVVVHTEVKPESSIEVRPINMQIANRHNAMGERTGFGVGENGDCAYTLQAAHCHAVAISTAYSFDSDSSNSMKSKNPYSGCRVTELSKTLDTFRPDPSKNQGGIAILDSVSYVGGSSEAFNDKASTLRAGAGAPKHLADMKGRLVSSEKCYMISGNIINREDKNGGNHLGIGEDLSYTLDTVDRHAVCIGNGQTNQSIGEIAGTLNAMHDQQAVMFTSTNFARYKDSDKAITLRCGGGNEANLAIQGSPDCFRMKGFGDFSSDGKASTLLQRDYKGTSDLVKINTIRHLTPVECERLQGLPDNYTNVHVKGQRIPDGARYKALGNGMAQPCADLVIRQIVSYVRGEE